MPELKPGWRRVKFGEVVRLGKERCDPNTDGIERYIGLEHIEPGDLRVRSWGEVSDGTTFTTRVRPGHVLFGKRRAYQRKVAVADFDAVCSGDIYVFESANPAKLLPELLPFLCRTDAFFEHAVGTSAGSLSPRTNWTSLAEYQFVLPPLEEQRRIIDMLLATRQIYDTHEELAIAADVLVVSAGLQQLTTVSRGACHVPLSEVCVRLPQSGLYKPAEFLGRGVPLVQMGELFGNDRVGPEVCRGKMELDASELEKYGLAEGDLLFGRRSIVLAGAGRCVVVGPLREPVSFESSIIRIRLDVRRCLPDFLFDWLRSPLGSAAMGRIVTFTTVAGIKGSDLARLMVPIPSLAQQQAVIESLRDLRMSVRDCRARATSASALAKEILRSALEP